MSRDRSTPELYARKNLANPKCVVDLIGRIGLSLNRHFPSATSREELLLRLPPVAFAIVVLLLWRFIRPLTRAVALEALWFQLGSAALLWWEANASRTRISFVLIEARRAPQKPQTVAEKLLWWCTFFFSNFIWFIAYLTIAAAIWLLRDPHNLRPTWKSEIMWAIIFWVLLTGLIYGGSRYIERLFARLRRRILAAPETDEEPLVRRALRTIGFALFILSTLVQFSVAWVDHPALVASVALNSAAVRAHHPSV